MKSRIILNGVRLAKGYEMDMAFPFFSFFLLCDDPVEHDIQFDAFWWLAVFRFIWHNSIGHIYRRFSDMFLAYLDRSRSAPSPHFMHRLACHTSGNCKLAIWHTMFRHALSLIKIASLRLAENKLCHMRKYQRPKNRGSKTATS